MLLKSGLHGSLAELPANFRQIRLELAREKSHPNGSRADGYTLFVPIDKDFKIDAELWKTFRDFCRVVRFRESEEESIGHLVYRQNGYWSFHYDIRGSTDDEFGYHLANERLEPGEYVSIREKNGMHTFQVISVERI